jgi:hypothetical protein
MNEALALISDGYWIARMGVAHICDRIETRGERHTVWTLCGLDVPGRVVSNLDRASECLAWQRVAHAIAGRRPTWVNHDTSRV